MLSVISVEHLLSQTIAGTLSVMRYLRCTFSPDFRFPPKTQLWDNVSVAATNHREVCLTLRVEILDVCAPYQ